MALLPCPECGQPISDQAAWCVHCGYALTCPGPADFYDLIVEDPGEAPEHTAQCLARKLTLSPLRARELLGLLPCVPAQGLTWQEAQKLQSQLAPLCTCKVVRGRALWTPESALAAEPVCLERESRLPPAGPRSVMTFWKTVGAILAALAIWTLFLVLLSCLF